MGNHIKTQLRGKITERLKTSSLFSGRVFENRTYELSRGELPAILVFSGEELVESGTKSRFQVQSRLILTDIYGFARGIDNIGDEIDEIQEEVEKLIFSDPTFDNLAADTVLRQAIPLIDSEQGIPVGAVKMVFESRVLTVQGIPDKVIQQ